MLLYLLAVINSDSDDDDAIVQTATNQYHNIDKQVKKRHKPPPSKNFVVGRFPESEADGDLDDDVDWLPSSTRGLSLTSI